MVGWVDSGHRYLFGADDFLGAELVEDDGDVRVHDLRRLRVSLQDWGRHFSTDIVVVLGAHHGDGKEAIGALALPQVELEKAFATGVVV